MFPMIPTKFGSDRSRQLFLILALPILVMVILRIANALYPRPKTLGAQAGRLAPCTDRPNCVCSQNDDSEHSIEPLHFKETREDARRRLIEVLSELPRARIVTQQPDYLHVECGSLVFGFVDDVEFQFRDDESLIHVRSASRIGYSDLGVNRKRVELIRDRLGW